MPKRHKVQQGEGLKKIAQKYGFPSWQTIWSDANNASLRDKRSNPAILQPGDIVIIPDRKKKEVSAATEKCHRFVYVVPTMKEMLRLKMLDVDDTPMTNKAFLLTIDGVEFKGRTNNEGMLEQEIPVKSKEGMIEIEGNEWNLNLEHLNPINEEADDGNVLGVQSRLNNLGIPCPESGKMDEATKMAIGVFQRKVKINETGILDDATKVAIKDKHGS